MIALATRLFAGLPLRLLETYLEVVRRRQDSASALAQKQIEAEISRRKAQRDLAALDTNRWFGALHRSLFIYPTGIYYAAIVADSLFRFDWDVAALPAPYDQWGWAIVSALFLADGVQLAIRTVRSRRQ